jgi:ribosomal protein S18 acetylase RimI-like enzyme
MLLADRGYDADWIRELARQQGARREARQYGIGERLIDAAVAHAPSHVEQLQLAVVTENEAARRLYAKAGFIEYGHQINALKHGARYYDDILMVKFLGQ